MGPSTWLLGGLRAVHAGTGGPSTQRGQRQKHHHYSPYYSSRILMLIGDGGGDAFRSRFLRVKGDVYSFHLNSSKVAVTHQSGLRAAGPRVNRSARQQHQKTRCQPATSLRTISQVANGQNDAESRGGEEGRASSRAFILKSGLSYHLGNPGLAPPSRPGSRRTQERCAAPPNDADRGSAPELR